MIATTSSGGRFRALAEYLVHGRSGTATDRIAWTTSRNLPTDDPELAAVFMGRTAEQSVRAEKPVYHLTINFDHGDAVTREQMERVADRVLRELGLADHEAVIVAHKDRSHPHMHLMVNRIHSETGKAWERWQDRPTIERVLREEERTLGLREVAGRLHQLPGQERPAPAPLTPGEKRQANRSGEPAFPDRVREHLAELRATRSWSELQERLEAHGLRLERKGQGLVITDGEHQVKASRVARDLSLKRLEGRFGVSYPDRPAATLDLSRERPTPAVVEVTEAVREYERVGALAHRRTQASQEVRNAQARLRTLEQMGDRVERAAYQFEGTLTSVYRDPAGALARYREATADMGAERAAELLRATPDQFGALLSVDRPRTLGLFIEADTTEARTHARRAATLSRELSQAEQALDAVIGEHATRAGASIPSADRASNLKAAQAAVADEITNIGRHRERLDNEIKQTVGLDLLGNSINRALARLEPVELLQLRRMLTAPQAAIAFKLRESIRDVLLGRDEGIER